MGIIYSLLPPPFLKLEEENIGNFWSSLAFKLSFCNYRIKVFFIYTYHILWPGIKRDKTMTDKLIYMPNDNSHNCFLWKLQFVSRTFNLIKQPTKIQWKSPKLSSQWIRKRYKSLGTSVINSPFSPPFLIITHMNHII